MKRVFALVLAVSMLLGLTPTAMAAQNKQAESGSVVEAQEIPGVSRLDEQDLSGTRQPVAQPRYKENDMVTVIVQLEGPSLLDGYSPAQGVGTDVTAGEAVSSFLSQPEVQARAEEMLAQQEQVLSAIGGSKNTGSYSALSVSGSGARSAAPEVVAQWTAVMNGMAIRIPYGKLAALQAMDGVKRAYVQHTYAAPEPVIKDAGSAGFSYDMVGLEAAWGAGYTGKGMLAAVVDTGLDLEYASFWDDVSNDNVTGVRRTHEAFREDSFQHDFADSELRFTRESMNAFLSSHELKAHSLTSPSAVNEAAYKNRKVPFAFDYAGDADPYTGEIISGDVNVYPGSGGNNHGTHVAGTVAGYAETEDGAVIFSGVAPDAQLVIMKVFADEGGGATDSAIMNALEDVLILGVDVVNLSLGSDNGFADDDTANGEVYARLEAAGLILMTSAGNSAFSSSNNVRGDYNLSRDTEISMVSAPSVYSSNISVASINNTVNSEMTLVWNDGTVDHEAAFTDPYDVAMKSTFAPDKVPEGGIEIIPVGGTGTWQDYYDAGFRTSAYDNGKTGIALVKRGELSFTDKVSNAQSFVWQDYQQGQMVTGGVKAVIIYDNEDGDLFNMSVENASLTSAAIKKADGDAMVAAAGNGNTITLKYVNEQDRIVPFPEGGEMSSFTSWGAGTALELKPEITAPGGNIWSSIFDLSYREGSGYYNDYNGAYGMMSGTSMAAPHMSGLAALVRQYVQTTGKASGKEAADLTNQLLVSTAVPQKQKDHDAYYSPRQQGAGLVDVGAAIRTPAYITVDGQSVGKLELLDDPRWTGSYDLEFTVHNLSAAAVTYNMKAVLERPDTAAEDGHTFMLDRNVTIKEVELGAVTVPANGEVKVSETITLTGEEIAALRELFPNGTYIEGFVMLADAAQSAPQIGLPYLAYLGDWTAAPIFDSTLWYDEDTENPDWNPWDNGDYTWLPSVMGSAIISDGEILNWLNLGQNIFDSAATGKQKIYHKGNLTISPNGDGYFDSVNDVELYQLRDAKLMVVEVRDAATGELYYRDYATYNIKTCYNAQYSAAIPSSISYFTQEDWNGTDLKGNVLPSGTKCVYTITAYGEGDYGDKTHYEGVDRPVTNFEGVDPTDPATEPTFNGHPMDKTGDVISFPVVVDYEAPKLVNSAVSIFEEDGHTYISGTVRDEDGSLASVEIVPLVTRTYKASYGDPSYIETAPDRTNPFCSEIIFDNHKQEWTFKVDVTEYAHTNESYPGENSVYDYTWTGSVNIYCGDYGANDRAYSVKVADMAQPGKILLSHTSARLHPGSSFELSVIDNSGSDTAIVRTSTNPSVATVDEFGEITAIAAGQTTIVVSNGKSTACCVVAVEDWPTEVVDFDLSIDKFEGLKPDGSFTVCVENLQPADVVIDPETSSWLVYEEDEDWAGLVNVYQDSETALRGRVELLYQASSDDLIPGGNGRLEVTLNGVKKTMTFSWEDLYTSLSDDGLVSTAFYNEQTIYVPYGETATLTAKYRQSHDVIPVALYTAKGAADYQLNSTDPAEGLVLDAKPFAIANSAWSGKLVNKAGYALPESIRLYTRYSDYEVPYYGTVEYDSTTGEIHVPYAPTGTVTMVIRADGVVSEGAAAGEVSGETYEVPDGTFGPFDWSMTSGMTGVPGELTTEDVTDYSGTKNVAKFTPSAPGVSYITATSKNGQYAINFAVVCEPVLAESMELNRNELELPVGGSSELVPTLNPTPTLVKNAEVVWTSFNPAVATVDENGKVTAVSEGYAYIKAALRTDTSIQSYCVVKVGQGDDIGPYPIVFELNGGELSGAVPAVYVKSAQEQTLNLPVPTRSDYIFLGWTYGDVTEPVETVVLPANLTGELTLTANWKRVSEPAPSIPGGTSGIPSTSTETIEHPDGSVTTIVTNNKTGAVTETTVAPDGSKTEKAVDADKNVTITVTNPDGEVLAKVSLPAEVSAPATRFVDVPVGHWADEAIHNMAGLGLVNGVGNDRFSMNGSMTRGDLATILFRAANGKAGIACSFEDIPAGAYYADAVAWAAQVGIVTGYSDTKFGPKDTITREQLAVMLCRFAKLLGVDTSASSSALDAFTDKDSVHDWAADAMAWCVANGIITGTTETTLSPSHLATRAQVAVMIDRFIGLVK